MIIRVSYESTPLVESPDPSGIDVSGAVVKISPVVDATTAKTIDAAAIRRDVMSRGALAVVVRPRIRRVETTAAAVERVAAADPIEQVRAALPRFARGRVLARAGEMVGEMA